MNHAWRVVGHFGNYTRDCHSVILLCFANIARALELDVTHITDHSQSLCFVFIRIQKQIGLRTQMPRNGKKLMKLLHDVTHTHIHLDQDSDVS